MRKRRRAVSQPLRAARRHVRAADAHRSARRLLLQTQRCARLFCSLAPTPTSRSCPVAEAAHLFLSFPISSTVALEARAATAALAVRPSARPHSHAHTRGQTRAFSPLHCTVCCTAPVQSRTSNRQLCATAGAPSSTRRPAARTIARRRRVRPARRVCATRKQPPPPAARSARTTRAPLQHPQEVRSHAARLVFLSSPLLFSLCRVMSLARALHYRCVFHFDGSCVSHRHIDERQTDRRQTN